MQDINRDIDELSLVFDNIVSNIENGYWKDAMGNINKGRAIAHRIVTKTRERERRSA